MQQFERSDNSVISQFSSHLFWDVDRSKLDLNQHLAFITERVLEYGFLSDWRLLRSLLSVGEVAELAKQLRQLDPKALAFITTISHTSKEEYRCYTTKQSNPAHWNF